MKFFGIILLLFIFHCSATAEKGVVVKIFPDQLILSIDCEAQTTYRQKSLLFSIFAKIQLMADISWRFV